MTTDDDETLSPEVADIAELAALHKAAIDRISRRLRRGPLSDDERAALTAWVANTRRTWAEVAFLIHDDPGDALRAALGPQPIHKE